MKLLKHVGLMLSLGTNLVMSLPTTSPKVVPPGCGVFIMENGDLVRMYTYAKDDAEACQPAYDPNDPTVKFSSYQVYPGCTCDVFFDTFSDQPTCQNAKTSMHIDGPAENDWNGLVPTSYRCWNSDG